MADDKKSIITGKPITAQTPATPANPGARWRVDKFNELIYSQGYDAYIDRALRCPCVDKTTGQALSTCKNCLGRGWFFVNRRETRLIAQSMNNIKRYENWSEVNRGIAKITTRAIDKLGFMDRVILMELEAYYSEILRPTMFEGELIAYPVYEPLEVTEIYLFTADDQKLFPIPSELYSIDGNKIVFDPSLEEYIEPNTTDAVQMSVSIRYSYHPVYHIVDANRELMKVREGKCCFRDDDLTAMPNYALARKAHYIFDAQKYGAILYDNSIEEL